MPYPNEDYISAEDQLRRQQELMLMQGAQQPYAADQMETDAGNLGDIETAMAQQFGTADYAELLRQGAATQKGAATTHYSPKLGYEMGRHGEELPGYNYASGQRPGQFVSSPGVAGIASALVGGMPKRALEKGMQRGGRQAEINKLTSTDWQSQSVVDPQFGNFVGHTPSGAVPQHLAQYYRLGSTGQPVMNQAGNLEALKMAGYSEADIAEHLKLTKGARNVGSAQYPNARMAGPAGMTAGALTAYLINKYTNAPGGVSEVAGGVVGGGVSSGMSGMVAGQAATTSTGAAAPAGAAAAGGAIYGGALGLAGYVASQVIAKHVFGAGKESGKDVGARQFAEQYQDIHSKEAKAAGFKSADDYLAAPYAWMTQKGRDYQSKVASGKITRPERMTQEGWQSAYDKRISQMEASGAYAGHSGKDAKRAEVAKSYADRQAFNVEKDWNRYTAPEYKPSKWEAWVGGMLDSGYKMKDIYDATAYYSSEHGSNLRKLRTEQYNKGKDYWLSPESDQPTFVREEQGVTRRKGPGDVKTVSSPYNPRHVQYMERHEGGADRLKTQQDLFDKEMAQIKSGEGLLTPEQRESNWASIQQNYQGMRLPWEGEKFNSIYEQTYGHMKQYDPKTARAEAGIRKPGKLGWYTRHYGEKAGRLKYQQAQQAYNTGVKGDLYSKGVNIPTTASVGNRFARMGVISTPEKRNLYGEYDFTYQGGNDEIEDSYNINASGGER